MAQAAPNDKPHRKYRCTSRSCHQSVKKISKTRLVYSIKINISGEESLMARLENLKDSDQRRVLERIRDYRPRGELAKPGIFGTEVIVLQVDQNCPTDRVVANSRPDMVVRRSQRRDW